MRNMFLDCDLAKYFWFKINLPIKVNASYSLSKYRGEQDIIDSDFQLADCMKNSYFHSCGQR
jgi:hypothetical protein